MFARLPSSRQLTQMLAAYPQGPERARGALQFLCGASGAGSGFLFVADDSGEPRLSASERRSAPAGLAEDLLLYWSKACAQPGDATETLDLEQIAALQADAPEPTWIGPDGESYQRVALVGRRNGEVTLAAVAVLELPDQEAVACFRHDLLATIGQALGPECAGE